MNSQLSGPQYLNRREQTATEVNIPEVSRASQDLQNALTRLTDLRDNLEKRLERVVRVEPQALRDGPKLASNYSTPLAQEVAGYAQAFQGIADSLDSLLQRVEL